MCHLNSNPLYNLLKSKPAGAWRPWTTCTQWTKTCKPSSVSRPPRQDAPCNFFSKTVLLNVIGLPVLLFSRRSFCVKLCLSCFSRLLWLLMIQSVLTVEEERCQNKCYAASMILLPPLIKRNISEHRKSHFCCLGHTGHCRWYLYHQGNQKNVIWYILELITFVTIIAN